MSAPLNAKQVELLTLLWEAGEAIVYGRAYAATADALLARGLILKSGGQAVVSMGKVEGRPKFMVTDAGALALHEHRTLRATSVGTIDKGKVTLHETCGCREAKKHPDCFYCGRGVDRLCGACSAQGIDGPVIRGTEKRTCAAHRTGRP